MNDFEIGRSVKHTTGLLPQTGAAIGAGDYVCMGKLHKLEILVSFAYGADADCIVSVLEAKAVAGTDAQAMTDLFRILANTDVSLTDAFTAQTAAANYTIDTTAGKSQKVKITVLPSQLSEDFNSVAVNIGNSNAANIISVEYFATMRYDDSIPLITDL
jgi:hypothetical protein